LVQGNVLDNVRGEGNYDGIQIGGQNGSSRFVAILDNTLLPSTS
jgi:hypothetical protein